MTETTDTGADLADARSERPQMPAEPTEPPSEGDDQHDAAPTGKYRAKLDAAEAERDVLRTRVEMMQKREVERQAGRLAQPSAIWAAGVQLGDLLDPDGAVDPDRVSSAINSAINSLGLAIAPRAPRRDPAQGARPGEGTDSASWAGLLRGEVRSAAPASSADRAVI